MRSALPWLAAIAVGTIASAVLLGGGTLNYDVSWAVDWGAALTRGETPDIAADSAPTSHPLATLVAALLHLVAGHGTPGALHLLTHVSFAAFVVLTCGVAWRLSGPPAGVAAALVLALSSPIHMNTALAFQDVTAGALIMLAVLLELRRPRHGTGALLALSAAGLLRPEAWGLAAAYWLWCALGADDNARRVRLAALAALGPGLWILSDLVLTGEPFLSFTRTREGAAVAERTTGFGEGPRLLVENMRSTLGAGVLLAAGLAAIAALVALRRPNPLADRRLLLPTALAALLCVAFLALAGGELSLLERYVIPLAGATAVLAGHALGGWWNAAGPLRVVWAAFGAVVVLATLVTAPGEFDRTRAGMAFARERQDLVEALDLAVPEACSTVAVSGYRYRPDLAYELDRRAGDLPLTGDPSSLRGPVAWVVPASERAARNFGPLLGTEAPAAFRESARNADWQVLTRGC